MKTTCQNAISNVMKTNITRHSARILAGTIAALLTAHSAFAQNTVNNYTGSSSGSLLVSTNWSLDPLLPVVSHDAVFPFGAATGIRTLTAGNLTVGSFNVLATTGTFSIRNETAGATDSNLTLGGVGNLGNSVSGTAADLLYAASGSTFNIIGANGGGGTGLLKLILGQSGSFNIAGTATSTISAVISDGGSNYALTKTGTGTLTLQGVHTYGGVTTVSLGTLQLGTGTAGQNGSVASTSIVNNAALTFNNADAQAYAGVISGSGTLTKSGAGTLTLSTAHTLAGTTTISGGVLQLGTGITGQNGSVASSYIFANSGTLNFNNFDSQTYAGVISGGGALTKTAVGTLTLSGRNTYTGATTISAGVITVQDPTGLGATSGVTVAGGAALQLDGSFNIAAALTLNGTGISNGGALRNLSGAGKYNGNLTLGSAVRVNSDGGILRVFGTIGTAGNALTVGGAGDTSLWGVIGGGGSVTMDGSGFLNLGASNTYSGGTNLNNGTVFLSNGTALGTSGTISFAGGTLQYSGSNTADYSARFSTAPGQAIKINTSSQTITFATPLTSSGGSLSVSGQGTLTLTALNTYSGATTVSDTATLALNLNTAAGDNVVSSASALTLGGNLSVIGTGGATARTQTFNSTTFGAGNAAITPTLAAASGTADVLTVDFGALSRNAGGTGNVVFTTGNTNTTNTRITTGSGVADGLITDANGVAFLTFGTSATSIRDWAVKDSGNTKIVQAPGVFYTAATATTIAGNADIGALNPTITGAVGDNPVASIRFDNASARTLTLDGATSTFSVGGILVTNNVGNNATVITGTGTLQGPTVGAGDLVIHNWDTSNSVRVDSVVGGTGGFTKSGTGLVILNGANTYTGPTTIGGGTLQVGNGGITGDLGGTTGTITNNGTLTFNRSSASTPLTIANNITGSGGITHAGTGTTNLQGALSYRGLTTVNAGTLTFDTGSARRFTSRGNITNRNMDGNGLRINPDGTVNLKGLFDAETTFVSGGVLNVMAGGELVTRNGIGNGVFGFSIGASEGGGASYGMLNVTGGSVIAMNDVNAQGQTSPRFTVGTNGTSLGGLLRVSGGLVQAMNLLSERAEITQLGGTIRTAGGAAPNLNTNNGNSNNSTATTVLNVAGGVFDNGTVGLNLNGGTAGSARVIINVNDGLLWTQALIQGTGSTGIMNFNGGTLRAGATSTTFTPAAITGTSTFSTYVNGAFGTYAGGAVIDTNNFNITLPGNLLAPTGSGVTALPVTTGGSGYAGAPIIAISDAGATQSGTTSSGSNIITMANTTHVFVGQSITGSGIPAGSIVTAVTPNTTITISQNATAIGSPTLTFRGQGATAYATIAGGAVTGYVITNPGVGYVGMLSATLSGGTVTGGTAATISGAGITTAANTSGGLTKNGLGTLTLPGANTFTGALAVNGGSLTISGTSGRLNGGNYAGNISIAGGSLLTYNSSQTQTLSGGISGAGGLTQAGLGGLTLTSNTSNYMGATNVTGGLLTATQQNSLGATSILSLGASGRFNYAPASASTLTVANLAMVSGSTIGTSFGSTIASTAAATTAGTINLLPSGTYVSGNPYTLLSAPSGLDTPAYQVLNPTDYTYSLTVLPGSVAITPTSATALTTAAWKGGFPGATGVWAVSNGSTQSNWQVTDTVNQPLVPGSGADVTFSTATSPGTMAGMSLGTNMTVKSVTITNTGSAFGLNADGSTLTISPASPTAGITIGAGVQVGTIAANVNLGSSQTWTNNSSNTLTVSGIVSGGNALSIAGTNVGLLGNPVNAVVLSGANTHTGATNINSGTLRITNAVGLVNTSGVNLTSGGRLQVSVAGANLSKLSAASGGSGVVLGSFLLMDQASLSNPGTIFGTLEWNSSGSGFDWNSSTSFIPDLGQGAKLISSSSSKSWQSNITFSGDAIIDSGPSQFNGNNNSFFASTAGLKTLTLTGTTKVVLSGIHDSAGQMRVVWNNSSTGANQSQFNNASTFTGGTTILQGVVFSANTTGAGTATGASITFGPSAAANSQFYFNNDTTLVGLNTDPTASTSVTVAPNNAARTLTINNPVANTYAGVLSNTGAAGAGTLNIVKGAAGTLTLSGSRTYTGLTTVNGGTLQWNGANNLSGALTVNAGGTFSMTDGTARNLTTTTLTMATGSTLAFDWDAGAVDNLAPSVAVTPSGVSIGIQINPTNSPSGGPLDLITGIGGSTLNNPNYFLANNTNFSATITKTTTSVQIGSYASVGALTNAYWLGNQVPNATGAMALSRSDGTVASNWASDATGTPAGGVVPGGSAVNVIFGATGASQQSSVTTGADMNLGSVTFNDGAAVTIAGSYFLTLNSTSSTAASTSGALAAVTAGSAVSVTSFANATNSISAGVVVGSAQTWNIDTGKTLVMSGVLTGASANSLTLKGGGTLTLSGSNTFAGAITIDNATSGTTLKMGGANALGSGTGSALNVSGVTVSGTGAALDLNGVNLAANTTRVGQILTLNGTGISSNGALTNSTNTQSTYAGLVQLGSASTIVGGIGGNTSGGIILGNPLTITGATFGLTIAGTASNSRIDSIIGTTAGTLTKEGTGTWTLNAANTHSGTTLVSAGTLALGNVNAVQNSTLDTGPAGAQTVTLTVGGTNTYNLGGLQGADALAAGSNSLRVGLNNTNATFTGDGTGATFTKVGTGTQDLNGASQNFGALFADDGTLNVNGTLGTGSSVVTVTDAPGGAATKLRFGSVSQTLSSLTIGAGATVVFTSGVASGSLTGDDGSGKAAGFGSPASGFGGGATVPEPGTIGLLLVGALGVLNRRRRA